MLNKIKREVRLLARAASLFSIKKKPQNFQLYLSVKMLDLPLRSKDGAKQAEKRTRAAAIKGPGKDADHATHEKENKQGLQW